MTKIKRLIEPAIHVIIWLSGFLLVAGYVNTLGYIKRGTGNFIYPVAMGTIINMVLFYSVSLWLIPRAGSRKYRVRFVASLLAVLLALTITESLLDFFLFPVYYSSHEESYLSQFFVTLAINIFILALALAYGFTRVWLKGEKQRQELKSEKLAAELNYLKAQVNPHFLFNMLNLAFASATKNGDDFTADLIEKIASQMRYMLYESNVDKVLLSKETEHIESYISLQKLRISDEMPVTVRFKCEGDFSSDSIAPLLIIPFIENAFKHGLSFDEPSLISIGISCSESILSLEVSNPVKRRKEQPDKKSSGIGLENVRKRLAILYPGKHSLAISEDAGIYNVRLQITLK